MGCNPIGKFRDNGLKNRDDKIVACYTRHCYDMGFGVYVTALWDMFSRGCNDCMLLRHNGLQSHDEKIISCYTGHRYDIGFGVYVKTLCIIFPGDIMTACY